MRTARAFFIRFHGGNAKATSFARKLARHASYDYQPPFGSLRHASEREIFAGRLAIRLAAAGDLLLRFVAEEGYLSKRRVRLKGRMAPGTRGWAYVCHAMGRSAPEQTQALAVIRTVLAETPRPMMFVLVTRGKEVVTERELLSYQVPGNAASGMYLGEHDFDLSSATHELAEGARFCPRHHSEWPEQAERDTWPCAAESS
jgi:hypothetical protein